MKDRAFKQLYKKKKNTETIKKGKALRNQNVSFFFFYFLMAGDQEEPQNWKKEGTEEP